MGFDVRWLYKVGFVTLWLWNSGISDMMVIKVGSVMVIESGICYMCRESGI